MTVSALPAGGLAESRRKKTLMRRDERIHAVACAIAKVVEIPFKQFHNPIMDAKRNPIIKKMAEVALDTADATRGSCRPSYKKSAKDAD